MRKGQNLILEEVIPQFPVPSLDEPAQMVLLVQHVQIRHPLGIEVKPSLPGKKYAGGVDVEMGGPLDNPAVRFQISEKSAQFDRVQGSQPVIHRDARDRPEAMGGRAVFHGRLAAPSKVACSGEARACGLPWNQILSLDRPFVAGNIPCDNLGLWVRSSHGHCTFPRSARGLGPAGIDPGHGLGRWRGWSARRGDRAGGGRVFREQGPPSARRAVSGMPRVGEGQGRVAARPPGRGDGRGRPGSGDRAGDGRKKAR